MYRIRQFVKAQGTVKGQRHPYHYRQAQDVLQEDLPQRLQVCFEHGHIFLSNIIFSNEATFKRNGIFNMHNEHVWVFARKVHTTNIII